MQAVKSGKVCAACMGSFAVVTTKQAPLHYINETRLFSRTISAYSILSYLDNLVLVLCVSFSHCESCLLFFPGPRETYGSLLL